MAIAEGGGGSVRGCVLSVSDAAGRSRKWLVGSPSMCPSNALTWTR